MELFCWFNTLTAFPTLLFLGCPEGVLSYSPPPRFLKVRICLLTQVHNTLTFFANDPFTARETRYALKMAFLLVFEKKEEFKKETKET